MASRPKGGGTNDEISRHTFLESRQAGRLVVGQGNILSRTREQQKSSRDSDRSVGWGHPRLSEGRAALGREISSLIFALGTVLPYSLKLKSTHAVARRRSSGPIRGQEEAGNATTGKAACTVACCLRAQRTGHRQLILDARVMNLPSQGFLPLRDTRGQTKMGDGIRGATRGAGLERHRPWLPSVVAGSRLGRVAWARHYHHT